MDFQEGELLYIDKPLRWTSFDVVKRLRSALTRRLGVKRLKVGHAGTLDPLATGVMILATGRATRRIEQLQAGVKEYIATLQLGATTPSFDLEKPIDATYPTGHITLPTIEEALTQFRGTIEQAPPEFSAVKVDGKRAYLFARKGQPVDMPTKTLTIDELEVLAFDAATMQLTLRIVCSKGTYIRALARDIGRVLDSGAHLIALQRTRVGDVTLADCLTVDQAVELVNITPITTQEQSHKR